MSVYSPKSKALALIPKFTGFLSLCGSVLIFQDALRDPKKRSKVFHRLMLGLSAYDIMASVANVLSTWPMPAGTPGVYLASGTTRTCTAQGFFAETGNVCTPLYNASLCLYYILIIRCGWSEQRLRAVEPYLHAAPLIIGWAMGVLGLPFDLYNNSGWLCWIAPYPSNCRHDPSVPCERGYHASLFRWIHYGFVWSAIAFVTVGMALIYGTVRRREKASERFTHAHHRASVLGGAGVSTGSRASGAPKRTGWRRFSIRGIGAGGGNVEDGLEASAAAAAAAGGCQRNKHSRKVATQAMLFVSALYLTWIFTTLTRIFQIVHGKSYFPLLILMAIFFPLQGFFNAMIYLRPRLIRARERNPNLSWFRVFVVVVRSTGGNGDDSNYFAPESTVASIASRAARAVRRLSSVISRKSSMDHRGSLASSAGASSSGRSLSCKEGGRDAAASGGVAAAAASGGESGHPSGILSNSPGRKNGDGKSDDAAAPPSGKRNSVQWAANIVAQEMLAYLDDSDDEDDNGRDSDGGVPVAKNSPGPRAA